MWKPKNICVIGAGGIGSFYVEHLHRLMFNEQIPMDIGVTIVDNDRVEIKNISYQNFTEDEILKKKAEALGERYSFVSQFGKIEDENQLEEYDCFIICVDNSATRKLIYEYAYKTGKFFLDMRAEGRQIAVITSDLDKKEAMGSLPKKVSNEGGSCQLEYEFDKGIIQYGNVIVSAIGSQIFLNKIRGDNYNPKIIMRL